MLSANFFQQKKGRAERRGEGIVTFNVGSKDAVSLTVCVLDIKPLQETLDPSKNKCLLRTYYVLGIVY